MINNMLKKTKVVCWFSFAISCLVLTSGNASTNINGILGDVMKEQLSIIRHCMARRCSVNGHAQFGKVSFHAYPSKHLRNIPAHTRVVFGVVTENTGKAYNPVTGEFTAPYDGIYAFHWTTLIKPGTQFATFLKVNGVSKAYNYGYAHTIKNWYSSSQMYVGSLKKSDKVWLSTDGNVGVSMHTGIYSTFSGFLL